MQMWVVLIRNVINPQLINYCAGSTFMFDWFTARLLLQEKCGNLLTQPVITLGEYVASCRSSHNVVCFDFNRITVADFRICVFEKGNGRNVYFLFIDRITIIICTITIGLLMVQGKKPKPQFIDILWWGPLKGIDNFDIVEDRSPLVSFLCSGSWSKS